VHESLLDLARDGCGWLDYVQPQVDARIRLLCFPFVGGDASVFRPWQASLPSWIQVLPVQFPGRGRRFAEPPVTNLTRLTAALVDALHPLMDRPFAFYGHSMGAAIAFELARVVQSEETDLAGLFVSGCKPPHWLRPLSARAAVPISKLPEEEFIAELRRLNGTPRELLDDPAALRAFAPALRADFELLETAHYDPAARLTCPIVAFCGTNDGQAPPDAMLRWRELTSGLFDFSLLPGDHFFPLRGLRRFLPLLTGKIRGVLDSSSR
jgi:medium-chain acyl-[acyl-carrier-protein] hydrolase